jgi:NDP-sugar pyrophosphorylase family protein
MIAQEGLKVRAIQAEQWHDAIYPWDLLRINSQSLSDISPKKGGRLSKGVSISGPVHIGDEVTIGPNTIIQGPAVIGDNCEIGPNTVIMPNTSIGPGVRIEPFTYIGNTILMEDVRIGSHSRCIDSVVGAGTRFADHTTTNTGLCVMEDDGKLIKGKFGVVVGDRVSSAPFTVFNHCLVGNSVSIEEGKMIRKNIPDHVVVR